MQRGFTLIELILVLTLLAVAASLIVPTLGTFLRGRTLDSEVRRLLALTHAGQSRAISEGMPMRLWIDEEKGSYGLEQEYTAGMTDARAEEFAVDSGLQVEVEESASDTVAARQIPAIRFLPEGIVDESSPRTVRVKDGTGASFWLVQTEGRMAYEIHDTNK